ncbi:hypothetical protein [Sporosarcina newyorkensis]|nr:hypothetical protein [Sporosarcina newyorkensis]
MIDYSALPGSFATPALEAAVSEGLYYTVTAGKDETPIYKELNQRLTKLEKSKEIHVEEFQAIEQSSADLVFNIEAKEEVELRIDWLKRLYEVKGSLPSVSTSTEVERLRMMLSPVQTCPLKTELLAELNHFAETLPIEVEPVTLSVFDRVMELAIERAGDDFINLGKSGREHVINNLLKKFGEDVPVASIQEAVSALEGQVDSLVEVKDTQVLQAQLETLPLSNYSRLSSERKQLVTEQLIETRHWKGLASLDRLIRQLDAKISAAEEQEMMKSMESGIVTSLDISRLEGLAIQIR